MMKYIWVPVLFFPLLFSCKREYSSEFPMFSVPQPHNIRNEKRFARRYWGEYVNEFDSSISYIIFPEYTLFKYSQHSTLTKVEYDTMKSEEREKFAKLEQQGSLCSILKNDTLFFTRTNIDTAFSISNGDILRYFRGHYYLNRKGKYSWYSDRLRLEKNNVLVT
ncbi:MAG: hypothetical protein K2Q22_13175, partial [Cytophagales bacterium]|nr:hypothetical protein [Cytophagales bacterium]